jgi:SAVED-fused 2TM effector domain
VSNFSYVFRKFVDWVCRRRSIGLRMMATGGVLIVASLASGFVVKGNYQSQHSSFTVDFNSAGGGIAILSVLAFFVGLTLLGYGAFREWKEYKHEVARLAKKIVLVIEQRGLRDTTDTPLVDAVPDSFEGRRDPLLNDIRSGA